VKKIMIDGKEYIINDEDVDEKTTGVVIPRNSEEELEKTAEIKTISEKDLLEDTLVDLKVTSDE